MKGPIRFGIVGLGFWGKKILQCLMAIPSVDVCWACDIDARLAEETAQHIGVPHWTADYAEMMGDPELDAVCIATPENAHLAPVKAALTAGKHVFVEKPIAETVSDAEKMIVAASEAQSFIMPGHIMRFDPRYALLRERIARGAFGRVVSINARRHVYYQLGKKRGSPNLAYRLAIHDIDLALWYTQSPVRRATGHLRRIQDPDIVDYVIATLEHENGALSTLEAAALMPTVDPPITFGITVIGHKEMYSLPIFHGIPSLMSLGGGHIPPDPFLWSAVQDMVSGALGSELTYFVNCLIRDIEPARVTLREALEALRVAWAIIESGERGEPVEL
jgi:UDP-N-acetylglucosamine 3-dehydrogenase